MSSPSNTAPHLLSLVLHSKKALHHGEQLCSRAHDTACSTSNLAADFLALNARLSWLVQGILDQLKLANSVAKNIENRRASLTQQAKQWDESRESHAKRLDNVLERLESQLVPPKFHEHSESSLLFGSQYDDEANEQHQSASASTKLNGSDRSRWKTLRDFVAERDIEEATESMDNDRMALDDILSLTEDLPRLLSDSITSVRDALPPPLVSPPPLQPIFNTQEIVSTNMARNLESLAAHYDQISSALKEKEAGVEFSDDDVQEMNRDTEELPNIIAELERDEGIIRTSHDDLLLQKNTLSSQLKALSNVLKILDNIAEVMESMLEQQKNVETDFELHLASLQTHLTDLEHLHLTYTSYLQSYNYLLLELDRRKRVHDSSRSIVEMMFRQLEALHREEVQARETFFEVHGPHLPVDLCHYISNRPTKWEVRPAENDAMEDLPTIDEDLLSEAKKFTEFMESGSGSI